MRKNTYISCFFFITFTVPFILNVTQAQVTSGNLYYYKDHVGHGFTLYTTKNTTQVDILYVWVHSGSEEFEEYARFAEEYNMGILAITSVNFHIGDALTRALDTLSVTSPYPTLNKAPLIFEGMSRNGEKSTTLALTVMPEKVLAFVHRNNTYIHQIPFDSIVYTIPGLLVTGTKEAPINIYRVEQFFYYHNNLGAFWTLANVPGLAHENVGSELTISYLKDIIRLRMPDTIDWSSQVKLNDINPGKGWLGNNKTFEHAPYNEYHGTVDSASWLPSEKFAQVWERFVYKEILKNNIVSDSKKNIIDVSISNDLIKLNFPGTASDISIIQIYDLMGRMVYYDRLKIVAQNETRISISNYSEGLYLLIIKHNKETFITKLVK